MSDRFVMFATFREIGEAEEAVIRLDAAGIEFFAEEEGGEVRVDVHEADAHRALMLLRTPDPA